MKRVENGRVKPPVWNVAEFYLRNLNSKFMAPEHEINYHLLPSIPRIKYLLFFFCGLGLEDSLTIVC